MKTKTSTLWIAAVAGGLALTVAACGKDGGGEKPGGKDEPSAAAADPGNQAETAAEPSAKAGETAGLTAVLDQYEQVRAQLATDDLEAATAGAAELESAAKIATGAASAAVKPHLAQVATAAAALARTPAEDNDAVRKAFGEVSKSVVEVLSAAPEAREGWHVFECPMAQGYKKWVQPTAELSNPYMGTEMPTCGSQAEWTAGG